MTDTFEGMVLDAEEREILQAFEKGELRVTRDASHFQAMAKETLKKNRNINIRISENDLSALQRRAAREGLPYQTLIGSVLHKFASGLLKEGS